MPSGAIILILMVDAVRVGTTQNEVASWVDLNTLPPEIIQYKLGLFRLDTSCRFGGDRIDPETVEVRPGGYGLVTRWGVPIRDSDLVKRIQAAHPNVPNGGSLGVDLVFHNGLPREEAEIETHRIILENARKVLEELGWDEGPDMIVVGSSVGPLKQNEDGTEARYSQLYAEQLNCPGVEIIDVKGACASGGIAFLKALNGKLVTETSSSAKKQPKKRLLVISQENYVREAVELEYDPQVCDPASARVFTQAAAIFGIEEGAITLGGHVFFKEVPDAQGYLSVRVNYTVSNPNKGFTRTYEDDETLSVGINIPNNGRLVDMNARVAVFFRKEGLCALQEMKAMYGEKEWDKMEAMVSHYPSDFIMQHLVADAIKQGLIPKGILKRYFGRDSYSDEEVDSLAKHIKENGFVDLQGELATYPQDGRYGNAPAANTLIAMLQNIDKLAGKDVLFFTFGAGASFAGAKLRFR